LDWPEESFKILAYAYVSFVKKTWVGLKGLINIMFILVGVGLNDLLSVRPLLASPLLRFQVRLKGLTKIMQLLIYGHFFYCNPLFFILYIVLKKERKKLFDFYHSHI